MVAIDPPPPTQRLADASSGATVPKSEQQMAALFGLLRRDEVLTLAAILYDGQTQRQYAGTLGVSRSWVKRRVNRAARKLALIGVKLPLPGRGRRARARLKYVAPEAMSQLTVSADRTCGTWNPQRHSRQRAGGDA